jgi:glucose-6-phosphate dehydrogenase assembly protein OpcA
MEEPISMDAKDLRAEKEKVLAAVRLPDDLSTATARGQYGGGWQGGEKVTGFLEEDGMNPDSTTETYAAVKLEIATRRWAGVPFYLRTGKRLGRRVTEIAVVFKRAPQLLFQRNQTLELGQNALVIRVQPDEGVTIRFGSKVPGAGNEVRDVTMDFGYGHAFTESSPEAYERLILDVLLGDPPLFPRHEEVELSWKILDPVEEYWSAQGGPLEQYSPARGVLPRPMNSGPRRPRLEASMIVDLPDTTVSKIARSLVSVREEGGAVALGRVLTLVIVTTHGLHEGDRGRQRRLARAPDARHRADREPEGDAKLDAQIRVGGDAGASEVVVLRAQGDVATNQEGLVTGLLLPDAPVIAWWPDFPPVEPAASDIGRMAQRRITDASTKPYAKDRLSRLGPSYEPGDTDLAWTRLTHWREQLAAVLDQPPYEPVTGVEVIGAGSSPSTGLLAAWLRLKLDVPVTWRYSPPRSGSTASRRCA